MENKLLATLLSRRSTSIKNLGDPAPSCEKILSSGAACRTYNVLMAEGQRVVTMRVRNTSSPISKNAMAAE